MARLTCAFLMIQTILFSKPCTDITYTYTHSRTHDTTNISHLLTDHQHSPVCQVMPDYIPATTTLAIDTGVFITPSYTTLSDAKSNMEWETRNETYGGNTPCTLN